MNTLPNNWQPPRVTNLVLPTQQKRSVKKVIEAVQLDAIELAGDEYLTAQAMNGVAQLDSIRLSKARSEQANFLMLELEASFATRSAKKIANRNSPLAGF